jgi:VIT1/CCC1 family predicted Fe2+/Mn2+ transporter
MMVLATVLALGVLALLIFTTVKSIINERTKGRSIWREFGRGWGPMILFFTTWIAHGIAE